MSSVGRTKTAAAADHFGDDHTRRLVEGHAAVFLGNIGTKQPQIAGLFQEVAGDLPRVVLEGVEVWDHLVVDIFAAGIADHAMLVGEILRREHLSRCRISDQKLAAFYVFFFHLCFHIIS